MAAKKTSKTIYMMTTTMIMMMMKRKGKTFIPVRVTISIFSEQYQYTYVITRKSQ